jgi:membrane-bound lytic murein transglycosylase MltF
MAKYDKYLYERQAAAATECDRWGFVLSSYNGGEGNLNRDKRMAQAKGADPKKWWGHVEYFSPRAAWAFNENRGYPRRIILVLQPRYVTAQWGRGVDCRIAA